MKIVNILLLKLLSFSCLSQNWLTIPKEIYGINSFTTGFVVSDNYSQFEINPYSGDMWFISNQSSPYYPMKKIDSNGTLQIFTNVDVPGLDPAQRYLYGIDFTTFGTYVVHGYDGVYLYDGLTWSFESGVNGARSISSDLDTVYIPREAQDYLVIKNGTPFFGNQSGFLRMIARNGKIWGSGSFDNGINRLDISMGTAIFYEPDTCKLLDYDSHDFKFARNSDTLYVAGSMGLSLAAGEVFVDTITPGNSVNMPYPSIIEFEFDSQDNIWAVFGDGLIDYTPKYIGYYERATKTWTSVYDASNCPVDFTQRLDIEVDPYDNLWVCDRVDLHVLRLSSSPSWLGTVELEKEDELSVVPNPSTGQLFVNYKGSAQPETIRIVDLNGKLIEVRPFSQQLDLDLNEGVYLLEISDDQGNRAVERIVINREK